jgi:hypothetical protein
MFSGVIRGIKAPGPFETFTTSVVAPLVFALGWASEPVGPGTVFLRLRGGNQIALSRAPAVREVDLSAVCKHKHRHIDRVGEGMLAEVAIGLVIDVATCIRRTMIFETGDESASLAVGCTLSLSQRSSPTTIAQSRTRGGSNETLSTSPMLFRSTGAGAPQSPSRIGSSGATSAVIGASAGMHCMSAALISLSVHAAAGASGARVLPSSREGAMGSQS